MSERHIIKISVELRQVRLLVRFPCKLTFQLKTGIHSLTCRYVSCWDSISVWAEKGWVYSLWNNWGRNWSALWPNQRTILGQESASHHPDELNQWSHSSWKRLIQSLQQGISRTRWVHLTPWEVSWPFSTNNFLPILPITAQNFSRGSVPISICWPHKYSCGQQVFCFECLASAAEQAILAWHIQQF